MRYDVLLIEDDPDHAALAAIAIGKTERCRLAQHVADLHSAQRWLARRRADAVLLDLSLPDSDGIETIRAVRSAAADTPVIIITAHDDIPMARHSLAIGAQDYLPKQTHLTASLLERAIVYAVERQRRDVELQRFAAAAAHDIQAPIRQMRGFAGLLLERYVDQLPGKAVDHLRSIEDAATRLQTMVRALLRYARAGGRIQAAHIDVERVVRRVVALLSAELASASTDVQLSNLSTVFVDEHLFESLIQNLVENAIKYRAPRPLRLTISQTPQPGEQVLRFTDNGIGITEDALTRVLQPFERICSSNDPTPGIGLGLALCQRVAETHGGRLWLESEVGAGTTACLALPDVQEV